MNNVQFIIFKNKYCTLGTYSCLITILFWSISRKKSKIFEESDKLFSESLKVA